ncbi:hypothetical protein PybrP1_011448 [[Pythium] brassicae (nom. inval.)]|nr:hypothetical protein PybrP1_011448 [[Pythium] brassicae (nom. inval.)]
MTIGDDASDHGAVAGVRIRYGCKCGNLVPVSSLFFSELCQKPVCRQPRCSVEEFESYYCGYMLVNMPSKEASTYQNRSSRCFSCVDCGNALSTAFHETLRKYFFVCAHCRWDSLALGLVDDDPDTLVMSAVARERESAQEDAFHALLSFHSAAAAAATPARSSRTGGSSFSLATTPLVGGASRGRALSLQSLADSMKELQRDQQMKKFRLQRIAEMGGWKYEQAIEKVAQQELWLAEQRKEHQWPELKRQLEHLPLHRSGHDGGAAARDVLATLARQSRMSEVSTLQQRLTNPLEQSRDVARLFPARPPLRVKRAWRCVESIERGSAGILVKPQISPMSGDSSLPVPASWFKKANLAVHYMPIVTLQALPTRANGSRGFECVLLVENPLDEAIRLVCRGASNASETEVGSGGVNAKVLIDDVTPIVIGAYEDPNIADAFPSDTGAPQSEDVARNAMLVASTRNLAKIKLHLEMERLDETLEQAIENSALSFPVEVIAGVESVEA